MLDEKIDYFDAQKASDNPVNRIRFNQINDPMVDEAARRGVPRQSVQKHMVKPDTSGLEEPSLPQFPPSSLDAVSAANNRSPLKTQSDHFRNG